MRGRPVLHRIELGAWEPSMLREVLLALFFLAGALAGHVYALCCDEGAQAELGRYLRDFCAVYDAGGTASSLWSCAVLYFGGGVLVFLPSSVCAGLPLVTAAASKPATSMPLNQRFSNFCLINMPLSDDSSACYFTREKIL